MGHPITANDVKLLADTSPTQPITLDYGFYTTTVPADAAWHELAHKLYHRSGRNRPPHAVYLGSPKGDL